MIIGISEGDRDKLCFLWFDNPSDIHSQVIQFRFKKLVFGLCPLPAILGAVISHHLSSYTSSNADVIQTIRDSLYVDDLVCGEATVEKACKTYRSTKQMMLEGGFNLRKWNSNSDELLHRIQIAESMLILILHTDRTQLSQLLRKRKSMLSQLQEVMRKQNLPRY